MLGLAYAGFLLLIAILWITHGVLLEESYSFCAQRVGGRALLG